MSGIRYGWRFQYRDVSSETFPDREAALRALVARFPSTACCAEYFLFLEPLAHQAVGLVAVEDAQPDEPRSFSVRVDRS